MQEANACLMKGRGVVLYDRPPERRTHKRDADESSGAFDSTVRLDIPTSLILLPKANPFVISSVQHGQLF